MRTQKQIGASPNQLERRKARDPDVALPDGPAPAGASVTDSPESQL